MPAHIIDGKALAEKIIADAKAEAERLPFRPGFAAVLVGDNAASALYVSLKEKACARAGVIFEKHLLPADIGQARLLATIADLNARANIHAILLQLPLPPGYDADEAIAAINPAKDVDGFHAKNVRLLKEGRPRLVPGLPAGILELIKASGVALAGKSALVLANSPVFYEPLAAVLAGARLAPSFRKPDDADWHDVAREADVLIVAVGRPAFVTAADVKPGAVVIDVGTNRIERDDKTITVGDVADDVREVAAAVTPVPGGVGPMTVAMVVKNCVKLTKLKKSIN